ncbi:hypothetical protein C8A00DRAFT_34745 [Chaetomidium leptoderma]|uniref:Uncharacterized protein n=1 Tax=Chaetomidium leptoderma TaxID=669021 RepID=A0AAN6VJS0_9PEZI|nr:hypothetical protein C8A00DRAFT_34745 [Chaetomidium leptoderma]
MKWATANGISLDKVEISPMTGLVTFPGLDEANFVPGEVEGVEPGNPDDVCQTLWEEFLEGVEISGGAPGTWRDLRDLVVTRWLTGSDPTGNEEYDPGTADGGGTYRVKRIDLVTAGLLIETI